MAAKCLGLFQTKPACVGRSQAGFRPTVDVEHVEFELSHIQMGDLAGSA